MFHQWGGISDILRVVSVSCCTSSTSARSARFLRTSSATCPIPRPQKQYQHEQRRLLIHTLFDLCKALSGHARLGRFEFPMTRKANIAMCFPLVCTVMRARGIRAVSHIVENANSRRKKKTPTEEWRRDSLTLVVLPLFSMRSLHVWNLRACPCECCVYSPLFSSSNKLMMC